MKSKNINSISSICLQGISVVFFALAFTDSMLAEQSNPYDDPRRQQAIELLKSGNPHSALSIYKELAIKYPGYWIISNELSYTYDQTKDYGNALKAINNAITTYPLKQRIIVGIGTESEKSYDNTFARLVLNRGWFEERLGNNQAALADYSTAIKLYWPIYFKAYINRFHMYQKKGMYEKALSDINKLVEHYPNKHIVYTLRSELYFKKSNNNDGCKDLNKASELGSIKASKVMENLKKDGVCMLYH